MHKRLIARLEKAQELADMNVLGSECEEQIDEIWYAIQEAIEALGGEPLRSPTQSEIDDWLAERGVNNVKL